MISVTEVYPGTMTATALEGIDNCLTTNHPYTAICITIVKTRVLVSLVFYIKRVSLGLNKHNNWELLYNYTSDQLEIKAILRGKYNQWP
jgi:hypothetical protein